MDMCPHYANWNSKYNIVASRHRVGLETWQTLMVDVVGYKAEHATYVRCIAIVMSKAISVADILHSHKPCVSACNMKWGSYSPALIP